jgi:outer membrane protein OmpA-like peptidoglycan-associated protein
MMQNYWAVGDYDLAIEMYNITIKLEEELGLNKKVKESSLATINRTFTYPTSDHTNLTSEIRKYLKDVALYMKDNPMTVISITGHSDNFGTFVQNETRAKERANHVVDFLVKEGISKRRLLANQKGALDPVAKNETEQGRMKNRRVEIREIK